MALRNIDTQHNNALLSAIMYCHCAECHVLFIVMLFVSVPSVVTLSIMVPQARRFASSFTSTLAYQ
jgi:hypothetical protein